LTLIAPIRPLQLCADGGYQLRLGVLEVPLIMVPDSSPRASKGVLILTWRLLSHFFARGPTFLLRGLNAFRDASAGLVVPSCELAVARVHSRVPSSRAGMLTLSTVWPEPGLREQPRASAQSERTVKDRLGFFTYAFASPFHKEEGGERAMLPSEGAEHGVSSELLTGDPSGRPCPIC
jgi:hypothetical protein